MNWARFGNAQFVVAFILLATLAALAYRRRYRIERPPIGVFSWVDASAMLISVAVVTFGYSRLPRLAAVIILALVYVGILHFTLRPMLASWGAARLTMAAVLALLAADLALWAVPGPAGGPHAAFSLFNNLLMVLAMVGVVNMYVQTGITAQHVAALAVALIFVDYALTEALPLMREMFDRLNDVPFIPALQWGGATRGAGIPIGDVIIVVLWTTVVARSYGARMGRWVAASMVAVVIASFAAVFSGLITRTVPVMVPIGIVIAAEYVWLQRRLGPEQFGPADPSPLAAPGEVDRRVAEALDRQALARG